MTLLKALFAGLLLFVLPQSGSAYTPTNALNNTQLQGMATITYPGGVTRDTFGNNNGAPPLLYMPSNSACSLNSGNGDGGYQVKSADGKCWIAQFPAAGVDIRQFGVLTSGDAGPAIRAAYTASVSTGLPLLLRPAKALYQILSLDPAAFNGSFGGNGPYPNTVQPGLYFGTQSGTTNNVTIDFGGVTLQMAGTGCTTLPSGYGNNCAAAEVVMFDNIHHLTVTGLPTLLGINSGPIGPATEICALAMFNLVDFNIGAVNVSNFGGIGAATCGDWLVHGHVAGIYAPQVGSKLADFAFLNDVLFDHWYGRAANTSGAAAPQGQGFTMIYDTVNSAQNKTGVAYTSTTNWTIANSDVSGFNVCAAIQEGSFTRLRGNYWHGCTGSAPSQPGVGVQIANNGNIASGGINPADVSSVGDHYSGNGNATAGAGGDFQVYFNPSVPTGAITNVSVIGGTFDNHIGSAPINYQISSTTSQLTNFVVQGNTGLIQGAVSTGVGASGINRVDVPQAWTPSLQFGSASTGMAYSVQRGLWSISGRQMTAAFSITLTAKGTATGIASVLGLPFAANTLQDCGVIANTYGTMATSFVPSGVVEPNDKTIFITKFGGTGFTNVADTDFTNASQIDMSLTCHIN